MLLLILANVSNYFGASAQKAMRVVDPTSLSDFQQRALLIMDEKVVGDGHYTSNPCDTTVAALKPWSFGSLMRGLAGGDEAAGVELTKHWMSQFQTTQLINEDRVEPRDISELWHPWEETGFDLRRAPFQLMAIVNRTDLLRSPLLSGENAGEVRFVFRAVNIKADGKCEPLRFTVILEFGVRLSSCAELGGWAKGWIQLATLPPEDPAFRRDLSHLITAITNPTLARAKPNGSAIDHVRTNEALTTGDWQLREFRLDAGSGRLVQDTLAMTPREELDKSPGLTAYLKSISSELAAQDYWIPRRFPNQPYSALLGAKASAGFAWQQPDAFSRNTCNGCHGAANSTRVAHIDPETRKISEFLAWEELPNRQMTLMELAKGCGASLKTTGRRLVH